MRIGLIGNPGSWYVAELASAAEERGHTAIRIEHPAIWSRIGAQESIRVRERDDVPACSLSDLDAVIVRTMPPGSLEQVVFRMDVLAQLQSQGVLVLNPPKALESAVDKYLTTARLSAAGLPTPETVITESDDVAMDAFAQLGGDVVVKPLFGSEGRGLMRIDDPDLAFRTFRYLSRQNAVLYLQRFIEHPGYDHRLLMIDDEVIGSYHRHADRDFRTNVSRKGRPEQVTPSDQQVAVARKAMQELGCRFAGIDLLTETATGTEFVLEVNAVPGWKGFQKLTGHRVAGDVIRWIEQQIS